jgi:hypothetical protein
MKKFKISAKSIGVLERVIKAHDEIEAWEIMEHLLEMGEVPEVDGYIDDKKIEELEGK